MALLDRPLSRDNLLSYRKQGEPLEISTATGIAESDNDSPARRLEAAIAEPYEDDPLASARGTILGVTFGAIVWGVILWLLV